MKRNSRNAFDPRAARPRGPAPRRGAEPAGGGEDGELSPEDQLHFGFDGRDDEWLKHLHDAFRPEDLGSIGAYELIEEVSRGGQGVVWRAHQPGLRREIALKRLIAGALASDATRRRFEREIEAVSALHHPGIVTVYGLEEVDGVPLLAMEWVDGEPLNEWGCGRSREDVLAVFLRVCDAVDHAHQNGILHRDLKPSNVLVDRQDRPRVLDFGLAKFVDPDRDTLITESGFLGTPGYAAPEQIEGRRTDVRSDVFALGVMLYELLTGRRPYRPEDGIRAYLEALDREAIPRPSLVAAGLDAEVDAILLGALSSSPSDRYPSVVAFADDVRRYVAGEPVHAHPPTTWYELRKFVRRNRLVATLSGALFVTVVLFSVLTTRQAIVIAAERDAEARARAAAEEASERASREAAKAEAVSVFLLKDMIEESGPMYSGAELTVTDMLDRAVANAEERFADEPETVALLYTTIAHVFVRMGRYDEAASLSTQANEILVGLPFQDLVGRSRAMLANAIAYGHMSDPERAEPAYRTTLDLLDASGAPHAGLRAQALRGLADCFLMRFQWVEARQAYADCVGLCRKHTDDWQELVAALQGVAICDAQLGYRDEARRGFEQALEIVLQQSGREDVRYADVLAWLGDLDKIDGAPAEAIKKWREVLALHRQFFGDRHPKVASSLGNLGDLLRDAGQYEEATVLLEEAVDVSTAARGADNLLTLTHVVRLAEARIASGRAEEIVDVVADALPRFIDRGGDGFTWTRRAREALIHAFMALGDDRAAAEQWDELFYHQNHWTFEKLCGQWDEALGVFTRVDRRDDLLLLVDKALAAYWGADPREQKHVDNFEWGLRWLRRIGEEARAQRWEDSRNTTEPDD